MENKTRKKLKRRNKELYIRYFANPKDVIESIIFSHDMNQLIDESKCEIIFDLPVENEDKIYELLLFYPNLLKKLKLINIKVLNELYFKYGETIDIMKNCRKGRLMSNPRGKICSNASSNSKKNNCLFNIVSEDIILVKNCPILGIPLEYNNNKMLDNSPSIDKINPKLGYVVDNIQIISMLANKMKSSATPEQLVIFAKKMLDLYDK
jgi:hypothetical protein